MEKPTNANSHKSIRFPANLEEELKSIVDKSNEGLEKREYSFNGFVISACRYAIDNLDNNK